MTRGHGTARCSARRHRWEISGLWLGGLLLLGAAACTPEQEVPAPPAPPAPSSPFTDVTAEAGIHFVHHNGATMRRYLPETLGAGVAFFDADGDDWPDLYFVNGLDVDRLGSEESRRGAPTGALYRNRGDGTFEDVTAGSGLAVPFLGMGVAVGDVDDDGALDLYVTAVGGDHLFRNRGDGTFEEVSSSWGVPPAGFGASAAFLDFDRDGALDLFVTRYVEWTPEGDLRCSPDGEHRVYCTPEVYEAAPNILLRNLLGNVSRNQSRNVSPRPEPPERRFRDVSVSAGIVQPAGKTLGAVPLDHNRDGWPDLAVANDTTANTLWINQQDGTFRDLGPSTGMAVAESGAARGGMGIDAGDLDGDGLCDLVIGNFAFEMAALYRSSPAGVFIDDAARAEVGLPTLQTLAFGTLVFDRDGDGWLDLLFANGHIEPEIARFRALQSHAQPLQLFHNRGAARGFEEIEATGEEPPAPWRGPWVGRGLALGDYDRDGDLDVVLTQNGGSARLLRNEAADHGWLRLRLRGRRSNRFGYGTEATAYVGERHITRQLVSGRSYLSASEPVLTLGLGDAEVVDRLEVRWPSGTVQVLTDVPTRQELKLEEPASEDGG